MQKTIMVHHLGEKRFAGFNEQGTSMVLDTNDLAIGLRPMEALLVALAGCTAADVVEILNKRKTPAQKYRIEVIGDRQDEYPKAYTHIRVKHIVMGAGVTLEQLEKAAKLSHEKYCSVSATLNCPVSVEVEVEVEQVSA
jgi:putative redox protein